MSPSRAGLLLLLLLALVGESGQAAKKTRVVLWEEEQTEIQRALDELIAKFESSHPGIEIRRSHYKTEDLRTQFQTAAIGRAGPELILAPNDFAGVFSIAKLILPAEKVMGKGALERFDPLTKEAIQGPDGTLWGVPLNKGNHLVLYGNRKLWPSPPKTWEELIAVGKEITDPKAPRYALAFNLLEPFWFAPFIGMYGGRPLEGAKPTLDTEAVRKALTFVRALAQEHKITPRTCDYSCAETLFLEGKAALVINGDWALKEYRAALGDELMVMPLPRLAATGRHATPMNGGKYFLFNHGIEGKELAAARAFVEFATSRTSQVWLARRTMRLPSLAELQDDKAVMGDPYLAASAKAAEHAYPMPMRVEMRAVWDAMRPELHEVMAGRATPAAAARAMQRAAEIKIESFGR